MKKGAFSNANATVQFKKTQEKRQPLFKNERFDLQKLVTSKTKRKAPSYLGIRKPESDRGLIDWKTDIKRKLSPKQLVHRFKPLETPAKIALPRDISTSHSKATSRIRSAQSKKSQTPTPPAQNTLQQLLTENFGSEEVSSLHLTFSQTYKLSTQALLPCPPMQAIKTVLDPTPALQPKELNRLCASSSFLQFSSSKARNATVCGLTTHALKICRSQNRLFCRLHQNRKICSKL